MKLLKDVLEEWKREVEKKPPEMSVDQAYDTLGLKTGVGGSVRSVHSVMVDTLYKLSSKISLYVHLIWHPPPPIFSLYSCMFQYIQCAYVFHSRSVYSSCLLDS